MKSPDFLFCEITIAQPSLAFQATEVNDEYYAAFSFHDNGGNLLSSRANAVGTCHSKIAE
jgi:hypothetical protein